MYHSMKHIFHLKTVIFYSLNGYYSGGNHWGRAMRDHDHY